MDFHSLNAQHWGCTRQRAKQYAFFYLYAQDGENRLEPSFLLVCHPDVRVELLAYNGIILGEN